MPSTDRSVALPCLPARCEVVVVGAGPAGSACARTLALAGVDVVLVDQHAFPRDKVCGDGLIPDAHHALRRLGVLDEVLRAARTAGHVGVIGPRGGRIDVPGQLAVLPRRDLDDILARAAASAGARFIAPARFEDLLPDAQAPQRAAGVRLSRGERSDEVRAPWVVLATGAVPKALIAAGQCERRTPSAVALRGYIRHEAIAERMRTLDVVWHRRLSPGYGWIFPCPGGLFNIGVGVAHSHAKGDDGRSTMRHVNLREVFRAFTEVHPRARELVSEGTWLGEPGQALKGAPLRCSLEGARLSRPGLLVAGEAAGTTYAFTGEGIGKALESGIHAAEAILAAGASRAVDDTTWSASLDAAVRADYESRLRALRPRFAMYEKANRVNEHPWLVDLLVWSAKRSPRRLRRMAGVLEESNSPSNLVTVGGFLRLFTE